MGKNWFAIATLGTAGLLACSGSNSGDSVSLGGDSASGTGGMSGAGSNTNGGSVGTVDTGPAAPGTKPTQNINFIPTFPGAGSDPDNKPLENGMVCDWVPGATVKATSQTTRCFLGTENKTDVAATVEQVLECVDGVNTVHLRLTFDPHFVDNTYGVNSIGWPPKRGHWFRDLVGSDHAELVLIDGAGEVAMQFKMDYISKDESAPSGYATLGVLGGDGKIETGSADHVIRVETSLDKNLNERGYGEYIVDSPATDENFTANPETPEWDYRMVYDVWIDLAAFGDAGFSGAFIEYVHASPAKKPDDTIVVEPGECPPCVDLDGFKCGPTSPPGEPPTGGNGDGSGGMGGGTGGSGSGGCALDEQCTEGSGGMSGAGGSGSGAGGSSSGAGGTCASLDNNCGPNGPLDPPPSEPPPFCERYPTDPACDLG